MCCTMLVLRAFMNLPKSNTVNHLFAKIAMNFSVFLQLRYLESNRLLEFAAFKITHCSNRHFCSGLLLPLAIHYGKTLQINIMPRKKALSPLQKVAEIEMFQRLMFKV